MHAHDIHVFPTPPQSPQGIATVIAVESEGLCVDDGHARFVARRATSCLVEPMPGDRVWVVSQGEHFVIAVLDRPVASKTRLHIDGDVELHTDGTLELTGEKRLALHGDELHVEARTGRVLLDRCAMVLSTLYAHLRETTVVGKVLETLVERVSQHSKRSYRAIAELEQVQAGVIDYGAEQVMHLHAKQAMVRAEQLVKMDGDQIHLG